MIVICCRSWMGYCVRQMLLHPSNTVIGNSSWYFILMALTLITRSAIPRNFAFFKPDSKSEAKPENRRDLLNAYDNTIRYTDYILHGIVERLQKWEKTQAKTDGVYSQPTSAMLYTSDHGENIFDDDRRLFLHAARKASDYELHVPFIIWTSDGYGKQYPGILKTLSGHRTQQVQTSLSAFIRCGDRRHPDPLSPG